MSFKVNCTEDGLLEYPIHKHKNYEIMLYLDGQGYMRTPSGNIPFCKGTIIIIPPNMPHGSTSQSGFKNISVEGELDRYLHPDTVISFEDNDRGEGAALARLIYINRYGNQAYLNALCSSYICFLMQGLEAQNTIRQSITRIITELCENAFDPNVDTTAILLKSGYSEDYARSHFKRVTGKSPIDFLTEIRIRHACFLIDIYKCAIPLSAIAEKCGYLDYVYFSKKFKAVTGLTPKAYRDQ